MPSRVKVGPFVYTVDTDEAEIRKFEHDTRAGYGGMTTHTALAIHIDPHSSRGYQRETLWHELKHCACRIANFHGKLDEEDMISTTATAELMILRDNPELVAYLTDPD